MQIEVSQPEAIPVDVREQALALWERNRLQCGWFMRENFMPETRDEFRRCLNLIAKQGDRANYVLARKLIKCL
jgi:hypothetical protein